MRVAKKIIGFLFGGILSIIGAFGVPKDWATSDDLLRWLHAILSTFLGRGACAILAILIISYCLAEIFAEIRIQKLAAKPPINFLAWDKLDSFTVWQVALLWDGIEPSSLDLASRLSYSTLQRFKEHVDRGLLKDVNMFSPDWENTRLSRQRWVDYSITLNEPPVFLYRSERRLFSKLVRLIWTREPSAIEMANHCTVTDLYFAARRATANADYEKMVQDVYKSLFSGEASGIARKWVDGILYRYEKIPRRSWKNLKIGFCEVTTISGEKFYGDLKVFFPPKRAA